MSTFHILTGNLRRALSTGADKNELVGALLDFQRDVCEQAFGVFPVKADRVAAFVELWSVYYRFAQSDMVVIRIAASRAFGALVMKVGPEFPEEMITAFGLVVKEIQYHILASPLIVGAFVTLAKLISPPFLSHYFPFAVLKHHFTLDNASFSDNMAGLIQGMRHMGRDWLEQLLEHMLWTCPPEPSTAIVKALSSLVGFFPKPFFERTVEVLGDRPKDYITLFACLLKISELSLDKLNASALIDFCFHTLSHDDSLPNLVDNSCLVLAASSDVQVEQENESVIVKDETHRVNVNFERLKCRPSFYALPLPWSLLKPVEEESSLVTIAKFQTIGVVIAKMSQEEKSEVVSVFRRYLSCEYDQKTSAALTGLALSVNSVTVDECFLRKIVLQKKHSWFHCLDIVKVLQRVNPKLIHDKLVFEIARVLIGFSLDQNESLAEEARQALPRYLNHSNFDALARDIVKRASFFESDILMRVIRLLLWICRSFGKKSFTDINCFCRCIIEAFEYELRNIPLFGTVLEFLAFFQINTRSKTVAEITAMAHTLIVAYYNILTGKLWVTTVDLSMLRKMQKDLRNLMERTTLDLVPSSFSSCEFFRPLKNAMRFVFKNPSVAKFNVEICVRMFMFAPKECSRFIYKNMSIAMNQAISQKSLMLKFVSDVNTFAIWCQILRECRDKRFAKAVSLTSSVVSHCLREMNGLEVKITAKFCGYLLEKYDKGETEVSEFFSKLSRNEMSRIAYASKSDELFTCFLSDYDFPRLTERRAPLRVKTERVFDANNLEESIQYAFMTENLTLLKELDKFCEENEVQLPFAWFCGCPSKLFAEAEQILTHRLHEPIDIVTVLNNVRKPWGSLAVSVISRKADALLTALSEKEKITKSELTNLCFLVGRIPFTESKLLSFANCFCLEAQKPKRMRIALRLFTLALQTCGKISDDFITAFLQQISDKMDHLPLFEMSNCFKVMANRVRNKNILRSSVFFYDSMCEKLSLVRGHFFQVRLLYFDRSNEFPAFYGQAEVDMIEKYLRSKRPSAFMTGLRLTKQALFVMHGTEAAAAVDVLVKLCLRRPERFWRLAAPRELIADIVNTVLVNNHYPTTHKKITDYLKWTLSISSRSASYVINLRWLPLALVRVPDCKVMTQSLDLFSNIRSVEIFDLAIDILTAHLESVGMKEKGEIIMNSFMTFLSDHRDHQNCHSFYFLNSFSRFFENADSQQLLLHFFVNAQKSVRFFPVCVCLAVAIKRSKKPLMFVDILHILEGIVGDGPRRDALVLLRDSYDPIQLVELASVDGNAT